MNELPEVTCSETLTVEQYQEIMNEIWKYHRFGSLSKSSWSNDERINCCKHIKYVRPNWDMRDGRCFSIRFDNVHFDFRGSHRSMFVEW